MKTTYTYNYEMPSVAVDCVIFGFVESGLKLLLIERNLEPYKGMYALPGGFVLPHETTEEAAQRELLEETGVQQVYMEQLYTFSQPNRDPRGRVVSIAYFALVNPEHFNLQSGTDAAQARWFSYAQMPQLAFDHYQIVNKALERLRGKIKYQPIGFELLPRKFVLSQLQTLYEAILEMQLDKRNFRKKMLSSGLLLALEEKQTEVAHKPARYFEFDKERYEVLQQSGYNFEL